MSSKKGPNTAGGSDVDAAQAEVIPAPKKSRRSSRSSAAAGVQTAPTIANGQSIDTLYDAMMRSASEMPSNPLGVDGSSGNAELEQRAAKQWQQNMQRRASENEALHQSLDKALAAFSIVRHSSVKTDGQESQVDKEGVAPRQLMADGLVAVSAWLNPIRLYKNAAGKALKSAKDAGRSAVGAIKEAKDGAVFSVSDAGKLEKALLAADANEKIGAIQQIFKTQVDGSNAEIVLLKKRITKLSADTAKLRTYFEQVVSLIDQAEAKKAQATDAETIKDLQFKLYSLKSIQSSTGENIVAHELMIDQTQQNGVSLTMTVTNAVTQAAALFGIIDLAQASIATSGKIESAAAVIQGTRCLANELIVLSSKKSNSNLEIAMEFASTPILTPETIATMTISSAATREKINETLTITGGQISEWLQHAGVDESYGALFAGMEGKDPFAAAQIGLQSLSEIADGIFSTAAQKTGISPDNISEKHFQLTSQ